MHFKTSEKILDLPTNSTLNGLRGLVKVALEMTVGWGHQHGELPLSVAYRGGR